MDTNAFDVLRDKNGAFNGFVVHIGKNDLTMQAIDGKEADIRTLTALLVWLTKNAEEIAELLESHGASKEGKIDLEIFPLSTYVEAVGDLFPRYGLTLEEFKAGVIKGGAWTMPGTENIILVVKDGLGAEFLKDNNYVEQIVFSLTVVNLLVRLCKMDIERAVNISRDFAKERVPLKPKVPTNSVAKALMSLKEAK